MVGDGKGEKGEESTSGRWEKKFAKTRWRDYTLPFQKLALRFGRAGVGRGTVECVHGMGTSGRNGGQRRGKRDSRQGIDHKGGSMSG